MKMCDGVNMVVVMCECYVFDGVLDEGVLCVYGVDMWMIWVMLNMEVYGKIGVKVWGDGMFVVRDAFAGRYVLDVYVVGLNFLFVVVWIVGVDDGDGGKVGDVEVYFVEDWMVMVLMKLLWLMSASTLEYYESASSVSLGSLLRNLMVFMVIMLVFLVVVVLKILEGIDFEELKWM